MQIILNGKKRELTESRNLENLVQELCQSTTHVIAEVNGDIVKKERWTQKNISEGDQVELINFVGGGTL